jgi:predicted Zn-dependent protease
MSQQHNDETPQGESGLQRQLDRREFLIRSTLAGLGISLAPALLLNAAAHSAEASGFQFVSKPSVDEQKKIGQQAAQQILAKNREVHDSRSEAFQQMGNRLVAALPPSDRNKWDYSFHVIDSKEINAFAVPGGPMFMYTGLYDIMPTLDSLAAVTGHEMTHVRLEHWAKAYQKQQSRDFWLGLGLSIFHAGRAVQSIAGLADNALSLKYSRGEEDQADQGGLENMVAAGFNPQGMIQLFQVLQKVSGNGGGLGGAFLSDHPLTSDRIKHAEQRIAAMHGRSFPPLTPLTGSTAAKNA